MLIEHQAVKPDLLTIFVFIEIRIVEVRTELGVKMAVGKGQADGTIGSVFDILDCIVDVGALVKSHQKHWASPLELAPDRGRLPRPSRIPPFHDWCQRRTRDYLSRHIEMIRHASPLHPDVDVPYVDNARKIAGYRPAVGGACPAALWHNSGCAASPSAEARAPGLLSDTRGAAWRELTRFSRSPRK